MTQPAEKLEPLEIYNEDDVWNALYIYGIKDSLGPILKFYCHQSEEERRLDEEKNNFSFKKVKIKDIKDFFNSLTPDQLEGALIYFIEKKDGKGLLLFYRSFNKSIQRLIFEKMLFEAFEKKSDKQITEEIRILRKKLFTGRSPENLDEAINLALQDNSAKAVLFLRENIFQIPRFINSAPENVVISVLLEIFKYIPSHS